MTRYTYIYYMLDYDDSCVCFQSVRSLLYPSFILSVRSSFRSPYLSSKTSICPYLRQSGRLTHIISCQNFILCKMLVPLLKGFILFVTCIHSCDVQFEFCLWYPGVLLYINGTCPLLFCDLHGAINYYISLFLVFVCTFF